jgi:hypothetical protein
MARSAAKSLNAAERSGANEGNDRREAKRKKALWLRRRRAPSDNNDMIGYAEPLFMGKNQKGVDVDNLTRRRNRHDEASKQSVIRGVV